MSLEGATKFDTFRAGCLYYEDRTFGTISSPGSNFLPLYCPQSGRSTGGVAEMRVVSFPQVRTRPSTLFCEETIS